MLSPTIKLAVLSRLVIILLQFISNMLMTDHEAGVFLSPKPPVNKSICNTVINYGLGGFRRWDAEYFLHIAEFGYTYENTLAFYPLYPFTVRYATEALEKVIPWAQCSRRGLLLFVSVLLNVVFFALAARALRLLTEAVLLDKKKAMMAVLLFCFNPASVFFSAPYSESLFAWLTFTVMLKCVQNHFWTASLPLFTSILCRSNGTINVGFFLYFSVRHVFVRPKFNLLIFLKQLRNALVVMLGVVLTFSTLQLYFHSLYCVKQDITYPTVIKRYAARNRYILAGTYNKDPNVSPWCGQPFALSYSYIQSHYWNVGLFNYYEWKQAPNFVLAAPILVLILIGSIRYLNNNRDIVLSLGLSRTACLVKQKLRTKYNQFVFISHVLILTTTCILFVHIQVSTRMLASSSPVLYWLAAKVVSIDKILVKRKESDNFRIMWYYMCPIRYANLWELLLKFWFFAYCFIGTVLFCNFYPWT